MDWHADVRNTGGIDPFPEASDPRRDASQIPPPARGRSFFAKRDRELGRNDVDPGKAGQAFDALTLVAVRLGDIADALEAVGRSQSALIRAVEDIGTRLTALEPPAPDFLVWEPTEDAADPRLAPTAETNGRTAVDTFEHEVEDAREHLRELTTRLPHTPHEGD